MALRSRIRRQGGIKLLGGLQTNQKVSGAGSQRYQGQFRVGFDSQRNRYVHVYGAGESDTGRRKVVTIRQSNPINQGYAKMFGRQVPQETTSAGSSPRGLRSALQQSNRRAQSYKAETGLLRRRRRKGSGYRIPSGVGGAK